VKGSFAVTAAALFLAALPMSRVQAAPANSAASPSPEVKEFLTDAIQGDLSEIKLGTLAEKNGGTANSRDFGKTLVIDHTQAQQQAKATAEQVGVTPPAQPTAAAQSEYDKLSKLKGAAFDREFADYMVKDHQDDIRKFTAEANESGPTSTLAEDQLPTLRKHLKMAQGLQKEQQAKAP
jgi:putative membrane protein